MDTDSVGFTARDQESEVAVSQQRKFTPEVRAEAVRLVLDTGRPIAQVARDISVVEGTLGNWVNLHRAEHVGEEPELTISERYRCRASRHRRGRTMEGTTIAAAVRRDADALQKIAVPGRLRPAW